MTKFQRFRQEQESNKTGGATKPAKGGGETKQGAQRKLGANPATETLTAEPPDIETSALRTSQQFPLDVFYADDAAG